jgi:hypothetical protein
VNVEQNDDGMSQNILPLPHPIARVPRSQPRSLHPLGPSGFAPASLPRIARFLILLKSIGRAIVQQALGLLTKQVWGVRRRPELTVLGVLEQNGGGCADLSDEFVVVALDVDVFVDELAVDGGVFGSVVEAVGAICSPC